MLRVVTTLSGRPGSPGYSTFYFGGETLSEAQAAADATGDFWQGLTGFMTAGTNITIDTLIDVVDPATGNTTGTHPATHTTIVTTGNAPLPASTQGLVRWRTGDFVNGREVRGRTFIPWLANDAQLTGVPSTGFLGSLTSAGTALRTTGVAAGEFGIYSVKNRSFHLISAQQNWTQFAVLRSRRD